MPADPALSDRRIEDRSVRVFDRDQGQGRNSLWCSRLAPSRPGGQSCQRCHTSIILRDYVAAA